LFGYPPVSSRSHVRRVHWVPVLSVKLTNNSKRRSNASDYVRDSVEELTPPTPSPLANPPAPGGASSISDILVCQPPSSLSTPSTALRHPCDYNCPPRLPQFLPESSLPLSPFFSPNVRELRPGLKFCDSGCYQHILDRCTRNPLPLLRPLASSRDLLFAFFQSSLFFFPPLIDAIPPVAPPPCIPSSFFPWPFPRFFQSDAEKPCASPTW